MVAMLVATSYFGNRILRHVRMDVRKLRNEGFDIVVHTRRCIDDFVVRGRSSATRARTPSRRHLANSGWAGRRNPEATPCNNGETRVVRRPSTSLNHDTKASFGL